MDDVDITPHDAETGLLTGSIAFPVAICPGWQVASDELQWLLQHWGAPRWRDRAFCRTRAGLERNIREHDARYLAAWGGRGGGSVREIQRTLAQSAIRKRSVISRTTG